VEDASLYERLLVMRGQLGDADALAELVGAYSPRLRYYLRKLVGEAAAEDVLQETWLAALRGLSRLQAPEAFRAWLYRIARDQAFGALRKRQRSVEVATEDVEGLAEDNTPDFPIEDIAALHRALDTLPAEQREALVLRFLEDMSYDEIARVTGANLGTVRSRLYYGKQALRAKLAGD
jgi:RNA polymerase sigma-70 factor (ECF subfamily)